MANEIYSSTAISESARLAADAARTQRLVDDGRRSIAAHAGSASAGATEAESNDRSAAVVTVPGEIDRDSALYQASVDFEALLVKQMLNAMRDTRLETGMLDAGLARDVFEDMLYDEYADMMTRNTPFGIADMLYRQLSRSDVPPEAVSILA